MENLASNYAHIKGWGIDADPKNDPTYPMRKRANDTHDGYRDWNKPTQQAEEVEIHHSIERPNVTAVFGTSVPPSGLSGMIRRLAFKSSENEYSHWLPLMLADRVNVVEGILEDFASGKLPNIFMEKGLNSDWKHNRTSLLTKFAVGALLIGGAVAYLSRDKDD